ncbi:crosslink repair DNA glycosylase YcaQ family protein [Glaciihabitans sp. UYNi722]|uniref:DNA glycosylase AlkZ-like family protein n=1 Tax=Glaciihabitans sp. UYNi722 TaxID=3156344 RepID=UPI003399BB0C
MTAEPSTVRIVTVPVPEAIAALEQDDGGRVAFLSPYDGMLFDRPRLNEIFEFEYVLEQFKPKPQRKYGFFAHPILMGDRLVGMLDAEVDRERDVLKVTAVHEFLPFDAEEDEMVRTEIAALAMWLGIVLDAW